MEALSLLDRKEVVVQREKKDKKLSKSLRKNLLTKTMRSGAIWYNAWTNMMWSMRSHKGKVLRILDVNMVQLNLEDNLESKVVLGVTVSLFLIRVLTSIIYSLDTKPHYSNTLIR